MPKRLLVPALAALAALLLAVNALADGQPAEPDLTSQLAGAICENEAHTIGLDAFRAKYGQESSSVACVAQQTATAASALAGCTKGGPGDQLYCARQALGLPNLGSSSSSGSQPTPSTDQGQTLAGLLCVAEYQTLGADGFRQKYGQTESSRACVQQQLAAAQAALASCQSAGGPGDQLACARTKLGVDFKPPPTTTSTGPTTDLGQTLATALCTQEANANGMTAFRAKYGQTEPYHQCIPAQLPAVQAALGQCQTGGPGDRAACARKLLGLTDSTPGVGQPAPGPNVKSLALALCQQIAQSIGTDAFKQTYGQTEAFGNCAQQQLPEVQAALDACQMTGGGNDAVGACVKSKLGQPKTTSSALRPTLVVGIGAAEKLATSLCSQAARALGLGAFRLLFGQLSPGAACVQRELPGVQLALSACQTSGRGPAGLAACVRAKLGVGANLPPKAGSASKA